MVMPNSRQNPYIGPRPFKSGETLYGRDREVRELLDHFIAERIILLYSPSGAGKTSLLSAGLIPQLIATGFQVLPIIRVSIEADSSLVAGDKAGNTTQSDQAGGVNRYVLSTLLSLEEGVPADRQIPIAKLSGMTISEYLDQRLSGKDAQPDAAGENGYVLIFDQFEEILTQDPTDQDGKVQFFTQLGVALRNKDRWALISMREDYIGALDPFVRPVPTRLTNRFRLDLLGAEAARQAVQLPANKAGVAFTDEAAIRLVDDLRRIRVQQPDGTMVEQLGLHVEPVQLQVVCYRLWQLMGEETTVIHEADLACIGDVNESLSEYYGDRVQHAAQTTGVRERLIRDWFQNRLITEHGIRSQVLKGIGQSDGLDNRAVTSLENSYLIRAEKRRGITWYELVHDRMIDPVRSNNETWYAANLSLLQRQAALWVREGEPAHLLLREQALQEAEAWASQNEAELIESEREFLAACREVQQREIEEKLRQQQEIKLQEQARSAKRLRALLLLAVVAAIAAVVFAYFAMQQRSQAVENADLANAESTRAVAQQVTAEYNAGVANAASTEAFAQQVTAEYNAGVAKTESARALEQQSTAEYNADLAQKNAVEAEKQAALAGSRQLAAQAAGYANSNTILASLLAIESYQTSSTWEAKNQLLLPLQRVSEQSISRYPYQVPPQPKDLHSVALSPNGQYLAFGSSDGKVTFWDYVNRTEVLTKQAHNENRVVALDFSPDGRYLASAAAGRIVLWDTQNLEADPLVLDEHLLPVFGLAFDPKSERLAAAVGKRFYAYEIGVQEPVGQTADATSDIVGVAWSPTGERVAGIAKNGSLVLWQPNNQNFEQVIRGHSQPGLSIAWSSNGTLASGGQDGNIIFWDTDNWRPDGTPIEANEFGWVQTLSFSSDGHYLASGSDDQTVKVWDVDERSLVGDPLMDHEDIVRSVDFDPRRGEYLLASAGLDNYIYLNKIATIQGLGSDAGTVAGSILSLAKTPQGSLRVATLAGSQVSVSEGTGEEQIALNQFPAGAGPVALSPDGSLVAIGDENGSVRVYEVDTGQELPGSAGTGGQITGLGFSQDGSQLAVVQCGKVIPIEGGAPNCEYTEIALLDSRSGESIEQILLDSPGFRRTVAIQPEGPFLAVGDDSGYVSLFDRSQQIWTSMATKLPAGISSLAFSQDGSMLASGNNDKSLQLWDVSARQPIAQAMFGAPDVISGLVYDSMTGNLFTGSRNGALQYWLVAPAEWVTLNCKLAGRNFTLTEWEQFFPDVEFQETCPGY